MLTKNETALSFLLKMILSVFFISGVIFAEGCALTKKVSVPYEVFGGMVLFDERVNGSSFNFSFVNKSEETVEKFILVFNLYDENGEPVFYGKDFLEIEFSEEILSGEKKNFYVSLDEYFESEAEFEYWNDFVYVKYIEFESGKVFEDAFGVFYL